MLAGALADGSAGFVPGLHLVLAICGGAFLLGVAVTVARVSRTAGGEPTGGQPAANRPPAGARRTEPPAARAAGQFPGQPDSVSRDPGRGGGAVPVRGTGR